MRCFGIVFGFGGKDGSQVKDGANLEFSHQSAQQHGIQDVTLDEILAAMAQTFIQRSDIHSHDTDILFFA